MEDPPWAQSVRPASAPETGHTITKDWSYDVLCREADVDARQTTLVQGHQNAPFGALALS